MVSLGEREDAAPQSNCLTIATSVGQDYTQTAEIANQRKEFSWPLKYEELNEKFDPGRLVTA